MESVNEENRVLTLRPSELGGNAPFIVFDDADIQTCVCANRILVQDGVHDAFTKRFAETAGAMKVADGFEPGAVIGPLIDMKAVEKVEAHIAFALKKGAKVVTGGKRAAQGGTFFEPTVLTDVTTDMVITKEETFGPVAPLYRFKTDAEAVEMANDTPTLTLPRSRGRVREGGAAYFYSRDIGRIRRVAEALEYGIVGINGGIISTEIAPFGGMKERHRPPIWRFTGARITASRNSSKSNTSASAASTAKGRAAASGPPRYSAAGCLAGRFGLAGEIGAQQITAFAPAHLAQLGCDRARS